MTKPTREQIRKRNDSLDIFWLQDESARNGNDLSDPADIAEQILAQLDLATQEMQELARLLWGRTDEIYIHKEGFKKPQ